MSGNKYIRFGSPVAGVTTSGTPTTSAFLLDATTDAIAYVFQARNTDPITHVLVRPQARVGTTSLSYIAGIEGVATGTAFPDGTYKTSGGNCSGVFAIPNDTSWDGTGQWIALDNAYTPSRGERMCYTVRYSSGTISGSNYMSFATGWTNLNPGLSMFPYAVRATAGSWQTSALFPIGGVRTASDRYGTIVPNIYSTRTASTVGHAVACKMTIPATFGDTFKVAGVRSMLSPAAATAKNPIFKLWSGTTTLASHTLDSDNVGSVASGQFRTFESYFDSSITLNCGTPYYFGYEVADATNGGIQLAGVQFDSAADNDDDGGSGAFCLGTFNGTSWTDDATVRPCMEFILEDFVEPSGGGGSIILPRAMSGGYSA